jgi:hypothetical protein
MMPKGKRMMSAKDYKIAVEINNDVRRHGIMFALPDCGRLMEDRDVKQTFAGDVFKPPYPMCILEFTGEHLPSVPLKNKTSKRVVFVYDRGTYVDIIPLAYRDIDRAWHPPIFSFRLYYESNVAVLLTGEGMTALAGFNKVLPDLFDKAGSGDLPWITQHLHAHTVEVHAIAMKRIDAIGQETTGFQAI